MEVDIKKLGKELVKIVGEKNVFTDKPTSYAYAKDVMAYELEDRNIPYAVVRPINSQEVSGILKYANKNMIPVHIHGSGTSLVGLARPKTNGIVLDTSRMTDIKVFPDRSYCEIEPGVHVANARKELAAHGAMLPIFPGSEPVATVGGSISVNTSAHAVDAALGKPGDYVLGLEVVLPTGEILEVGTESTRKPAGIEVTKFLVGSEGLLCVITKVRLRFLPLPEIGNIVAYYEKTEDILDLVMQMYKQGVPPPLFFEYLDESASKIGFEAVGLPEPIGAVAMMTMHSATKEGCQAKAEKFLNLIKQGRPLEAKLMTDSQEWDKIWSSRSEAGNYVYRKGTTFGSEVTPRVDKLKEAFWATKEFIINLENYKNPEFLSFGHIGAPTIHGYAFMPTKDLSNDLKKALTKEVREKSEELNVKFGGCGGEWGLTAQRVSFLKKKYSPAYYQLLVNLKKSLDPNNILNRGNLEGWT